MFVFYQGVKGALANLTLGDIVKVTVNDVNEHGALCDLGNAVKGFATFEHIKGERLLLTLNF